jgi:hypothetical protein
MPRTIYVSNPTSIPTGEHWAIIGASSVTVPGDERSRTSPGHGYPEHTENYITYTAYTDKTEFEAALTKEVLSPNSKVQGIHVAGVLEPKRRVDFVERK